MSHDQSISSVLNSQDISTAIIPKNQPSTSQRFNADHCRRFLEYLIDPSVGCCELRIFRATFDKNWIRSADQFSKTLGGWYDRIPDLMVDIQRLDKVSGFVTVNPVSADLLARHDHAIKKIERGGGTNDSQIVMLRWMFLDFDAERATDISATDEELAAALSVRDKFLSDHPEIAASAIWGCSGNGGWILVRLPDLPNDHPSNALVKRAIGSISREYSTPQVKVDPKTCNPARVMGIAGTKKCKGSDRPERPWRFATIDCPEGHQPMPLDLAAWMADRPAEPEPVTTSNRANVATLPRPASGPAVLAEYTRAKPTTNQHAWVASDPRTIQRITAFVAAIPPAISGQNGHDQTFSVATALVKGFGLAVEEAFSYIANYNLTCQPPWEDAELLHKLEDADARPDDKPRGYLLMAGDGDNAGVVMPSAAGVFDMAGLKSPSTQQSNLPAAIELQDLSTTTGKATQGSLDTPHDVAKLLIDTYFTGSKGIRLRYWRDDFHDWGGSHYRPIPKSDMQTWACNCIHKIFVADFKVKCHAHALLKATGNDSAKPPKLKPVTRGLVADVTLAMSSLVHLISCDYPNQPTWIGDEKPWPANEVLPTKTALIHLPSLVSGNLSSIPPTPNFFGRYSLDYSYDPDAAEPTLWLNFLRQIWKDDDQSIRLLREWMGYLLTPDTSQQKIAMLIGKPRSGKGTITRIITALMGAENVAWPTLASLATQFGLYPLIGKPVAFVSEARISRNTDISVVTERLLAISGEDGQSIDVKHQKDNFTGRLPTRFSILSNELPNMKDASGALPSRMLILEFKESFIGREDPLLTHKLTGELPQILKWAVQGWTSLRDRGRFEEPAGSAEAKQTLADLASPISAFIRDRCEIKDPSNCIKIQELFSAWKIWCAERGKDHPGEEETFGRNLKAACSNVTKIRPRVDGTKTRARAYSGIRLLTEGELRARDDEPRPEDDRWELPSVPY